MSNAYMQPSQSDEWETPQLLFKQLDDEFHFQLDVCATAENKKCHAWLGPGSDLNEDGLAAGWGQLRCWCNPPYSEWAKWVAKATIEAQKGAKVVMLLPARTDTKAFHEYIWQKPGVEVRFIKGRLKFSGAKNSAPFPSMIVIFT